jgi:hypothetical protein
MFAMRRKILIYAYGILLLVLISACGFLGAQQTSQPSDLQGLYTQAAQTVQAQLTQQAIETLVAQLTQVSGQSSATPAPPTAAPDQPTATQPAPTSAPPTPVPPTSTPAPTPIPCDWAQFVSDLTVSDGSVFVPNAVFTKSWRIRNIGACSWNSDYSLIFASGTSMSDRSVFSLPGRVRPGEAVDLSVTLDAPEKPGHYRSYWMLRNEDGQVFGIGNEADTAFWVDIRVSAPPVSQYAYDFAANYCSASWNSSAGKLPCPGDSSSEDGSVVLLDSPTLENGRKENELTLWTRPETTRGGWISGVFPAYNVRPGDHFMADIGCLSGSQGCDVTFELDYQVDKGPVHNLGSWHEIYDGSLTRINVDLSDLAGKSVRFILSVTNNGKPVQANAFWFVPSIRAVELTSVVPALTWRQQGSPVGFCSQVEIYLGERSAQARSFSCTGGQIVELGRGALTDIELTQLNIWISTYQSIDATQVDPRIADGTTFSLKMVGRGQTVATDQVIQAIQNWVAQIYVRVSS